jgi:hypothetical protein
MTEDLPCKAPDHRWTLFGYTFSVYTSGPQRWRWEASAHGRGVGGHRTPLGAFLHLRRWMKEPARPA